MKVIIEVKGGMIMGVYSDNLLLDVVIDDRDVEKVETVTPDPISAYEPISAN